MPPRLCLGGIDRLLGSFRHRIKTFLHFFLLFSFQVCCPAQRLGQTKKGSLPWWKAAGMLLHQRGQDLLFRIVVEPQGNVNKQTVQP